MKRYSTSILYFALALSIMQAAGAQASAQALAAASAKALPTVDQIVEANIEAIGGRAAIEKVTSRVSKGTVEVLGLETKGTIEVYEAAPNKLVRIVRIPGAMGWATGFDGSAGWWFNADKNKVEDRKDLANAKAESDFYQMLKLKERFPKMTIAGVQKIQYRGGEREVYVVETAPGSPEKFFFDTENSFIIRHDSQEDSEDGKVSIREFYLDYTAVDGVKIPFTTRINQGKTVFIFKLTDVKQNVPIDAGRFGKPVVK